MQISEPRLKKKELFIGLVEAIDFPNKCRIKAVRRDQLEQDLMEQKVRAFFAVESESFETVVVKNAIVGQIIEGRVLKKRSGRYKGNLLSVLFSAPDEVTPKCKVFGQCGGCLYQNLSYPRQLELKQKQVRDLVDQVTKDYEYQGIVANPRVYHYRNKMEYSFGDQEKDGPLMLGMHRRGSTYDICDAGDCHLVPPDFNRIVRYTVDFFRKQGTSYYHKRTHQGFLRYLVLRHGQNSGQLMVNLVTTTGDEQQRELVRQWLDGLLDQKQDLDNELTSVWQTINNTLADAIKPDQLVHHYGQAWIREQILGLDFEISPFSFFQTNTASAENIYQTVREYIGETKDKVVFDLYSGTGTIAQAVAAVAAKVVGVEIVTEAVEKAKDNAVLNRLDNCQFIAGDVLQIINQIEDKPDIIIVDPPREGIHPKALVKIIEYQVDTIVYISCKPTSLVADLQTLLAHNYRLQKLKIFDQFSHTGHVETVCLLTRK